MSEKCNEFIIMNLMSRGRKGKAGVMGHSSGKLEREREIGQEKDRAKDRKKREREVEAIKVS